VSVPVEQTRGIKMRTR